ncbi:uncharacterized protein LOC128883318 isoform X2 [Hylaeus volcanicus]|uniref:uncharacterized protein LOC128883318 isoform X2 n=1 Tax=Hylaeus volcanicus TaxID=313075 RepID=UPI0023B8040A|nr:uncharacterized protein LOC128883318 isoform X2 [Hylaeus volcanicus]
MKTALEKILSDGLRTSTNGLLAINTDIKNTLGNEDIMECVLEEESTRTLSDDTSLSLILGFQMKKFIQTRSHSQVYGKVDKDPRSYNMIEETNIQRKYTTVSGLDLEARMLYRKSTDLDSSCSEESSRTSSSKMDSSRKQKSSNCETKIKGYKYQKNPQPFSLSHTNEMFQTNEAFQKSKTDHIRSINIGNDALSLSARHSTSSKPNEEHHDNCATRSTNGENNTYTKVVDDGAETNASNQTFSGIVSKDQCLLVEKEPFFLMILLIDSVAIVEKSLKNVPFHFHLSWIAGSKSVSSPTYFFNGMVSEKKENDHSSKKSSFKPTLKSLDWCTYLETQLNSSSAQQAISPLYLHKSSTKEAIFHGKIVLNLTHEKSNETLALAAFNVNDLGASDVFRKLNVELLTTAGVFAIITLYVACQKRWVKVHPSTLECEPSSFQNNGSPFYNVDQDDQAYFLHQFVTQEIIQSRDLNELESCQSYHTDVTETDSIEDTSRKVDAAKAPVKRDLQLLSNLSRFTKVHDSIHSPSDSSNDSYCEEKISVPPVTTQSVSLQDSLEIAEDATSVIQSQDACAGITNNVKLSSVISENVYKKRPSVCEGLRNKKEIHVSTIRKGKNDETEGKPCVEESLQQETEWSNCKPTFEMNTEKSKTGLRELFHVCQQLTEIPDNTTLVLKQERSLSADNSPHVLLRKAIHLCIGLCQQVTQSSNNKEATEAKEYLETLRNLANRIGRSLEESVVCDRLQCNTDSNECEKVQSLSRTKNTNAVPIDNVSYANSTEYISHTSEKGGHTDTTFYVDSQDPKDVLSEPQVYKNSETLSTLHGKKPFDKNYLCLGYSSNAMVWKRSQLNHKEDTSSLHGVECSASSSLPKILGQPDKCERLFPEYHTNASPEKHSMNDCQSKSSSRPMYSHHAGETPQLSRLDNGVNFFEKTNRIDCDSNDNKKQDNIFQHSENSPYQAASFKKMPFGLEINQKNYCTMKNKLVDVEQNSLHDAQLYDFVRPHGELKQCNKADSNENSEIEWHTFPNKINETSRVFKKEPPCLKEHISKSSSSTRQEKILTPPTFLMKKKTLSRPNMLNKPSYYDSVTSRSMERVDSQTSAVDTPLYPWKSDNPEISHDEMDTHFFFRKFTTQNKENLGLVERSFDDSKRIFYRHFDATEKAGNTMSLPQAPQESVVLKRHSTSTESPYFTFNKDADHISVSGSNRQAPVNTYPKVVEGLQSRYDVWESKRNTTSTSSIDGETAEGKEQTKMTGNKHHALRRMTSAHIPSVQESKKKSLCDLEGYRTIASLPVPDENFLPNQNHVKKKTVSNALQYNKDLYGGTRVSVIKERLNYTRILEKTQSEDEFLQPSTLLFNGSNAQLEARQKPRYRHKNTQGFVKKEYARQAENCSDSPEDHASTYQFLGTHVTKPTTKHESNHIDVYGKKNMNASLNDIPSSSCPSSEPVDKSPHQNESNSNQRLDDLLPFKKQVSHIHTRRKNSLAYHTYGDVPALQQSRTKCCTAVPKLALHEENEGHLSDVQVGFVTPPLPAKPLPTRRHHGSFMCSTFPLQCGNTRAPLLGGALANNSSH